MKALLLIVLNLFCIPLFSQVNRGIDESKKIVYTLANDSMLGRAAGSLGEVRAKNYLVSCYKKTGLKTLNGTYIQKFTFPKDSTHTDTAMNIIGIIDNKGDSTIIIGAHYDHLGMGGPKSRSLTSKKIHPGADDNASGVAALLLLAEYFSSPSVKLEGAGKYNYVFIAFSAEEEGLYGSRAYVASMKKTDKVKLMINLVMVGRLDKERPVLKIMHSVKDSCYDSLLAKLTGNAFQLHLSHENINYTDAGAFVKNNIPALSFTTGMHDDYHKTTDVAEKINYEGINSVTNYIENFIDAICRKNNKD
ncbi:MAG: M28 family peptidase [Bacteroidia bacterium]